MGAGDEAGRSGTGHILGYIGLSVVCFVVVGVAVGISASVTSNECYLDSLGRPRSGDCMYGASADVAQFWVPLAIPCVLAAIGAARSWSPYWLLPAVPLGWLAALCGYLYVLSA